MEKQPAEVQLKQGALGFWDCFMIAVGGMVGMAIFTLSGVTFSLAGPASLLAWVVGGLIVCLYALNVAEMATKFPRAGGLYVYPSESLGNNETVRQLGGWLAAWSWVNVTVLGAAFGAIFIANYVSAFLPGADQYVVPLGLLSVGLVWLLNVLGITLMGRANLILTACLMAICLVFSLQALPNMRPGAFTPFFAGFLGMQGFVSAIPIAMLAYGSVIAVASVAEEVRDPRRTIPRAMGWSLITTIALYALVLVSTYGIINWQAVTEGSFGFYAPLHFAIVHFAPGAGWLMNLVSVAALFAITTTMLVMIMDSGRTLMAMGRTGLLPRAFAKVHPKTQTPVFALTFVSAMAAVIACFPYLTMKIISTGSFTFGVLVIIIVLSVIGSRIYRTDVKAVFTAPGGIVLQVLTLAVLAFTLTRLGRDAFVLSGWWYLIGMAYFVLRYALKPAEKSKKPAGM